MKKLFLAAFVMWMSPLWAQSSEPSESPAIATPAAPIEQPAVSNTVTPAVTATPATPAVPARAEKGTTVVGDTDSPIGLFIMPWRNSAAEKDIDRPARLLQSDMSPIDPIVFDRQTEYFDVLEAHAKTKPTAAQP